jgi:hypothetical protein
MALADTREHTDNGRMQLASGGRGRTRPGASARLAWSLWLLAVVLVVAGTATLTVQSWEGPETLSVTLGFAAVQLGAASAGAVIASRLPRNAVGWIFLALGVGLGLVMLSWAWAGVGSERGAERLPGYELAAWLGSWIFLPVIFAIPMFLLLLFPDGRFLSRRWRRVGVAMGVVAAVGSLTTAFLPGEVDEGVENPWVAGGLLADVLEVLAVVSAVLAPAVFTLAVVGVIVRWRRSRGVERQQLKWFTYAASLVGVGFAGVFVTVEGTLNDVFFTIALFALAGVPIAAGIAMLRYRLYDIDVVINRTLVYGALTATLAGVYVCSVLLLQLVLSPGSDLAIAGSTLAVAALFRPARGRIQEAVDRRFYRRKYDAAQTVATFSTRLRDEIELDHLSAELQAVVANTMQPAHISLWLRGPGVGR